MFEMITDGAYYIGAFLLIISVIVFIHEFGHYYIARLCGVRVEQFSIGFGKEMFGWNDRHGTRWKLSILPIGGYVKMFGSADAASTPDGDSMEEMTEEDKKVSFQHKSLPRKSAIVAAGPAANFILAIMILAGFFYMIGKPVAMPVVGEVMEESAAAEAGLRAGDRFLEFDGRSMESFSDIQRVTRLHPGMPVELVVDRDVNVWK
jgi:regulator of sigma E protease